MLLVSDIPLQLKMVRWSRYLAVAVILIASLALLGWQFDIEELKRPAPALVAMNPLTAVCFILTAASFFLLPSLVKIKYISAIAMSLIVFLAGAIKIIGLLTDYDWQIDQYFFSHKLQKDIVGNISNSMAPNTAACLMLGSIALWLMYNETKRRQIISQYVALVIALVGWLSILGYLYKVKSFYGLLSYIPMAVQTAVCFLCMAIAFLFSRPGKGIMKQLTSTFSGSVTARLLIPAAVVVPSVLGLLRLHGYWAGIYETEFGVAIYTLMIITIFLGLAWYNLYVLNKRDILKRQTELALRESEEQISAIFKAAPDGVIVIDSEGRIVKWNQEAENLFGWTSEEVIGKLLSDTIIPAAYREAHRKGMQNFSRTGQSRIIGKTVEISAIKKDNSEFDVALRVAAVIIQDKHLFVGFVRDITERKKTEKKLNSFNEELSLQVAEKTREITEIFERVTDAFIAVDKNFCYTYVNGKAAELIHRDPATLIGKNVWAEFPDAVGSETYKAFIKAMEEQQYVMNTDHYEPLKLWQENHIHPSSNGLSIFIRDITEKKKAEIALKENEEKYRTFIEEAVDAILVFSPKTGHYVEANKKASELLGYSIEELLQIMPSAFIFPDDTVPAPFDRLEAGESIRIERMLRKKNGDGVAVETNARRLPNGNYLAFVRDISDRKKAEMEISEVRGLTEKLIDSLPGVFYFYDLNGRFIRWNKQFEIVTGYSATEIANMHPTDFFSKENKQYMTERIEDVFAKGVNDAEANIVTKTGSSIPYYFKAVLINYHGQPCLLGNGIDITNRKKAEEEMLRLNEELRKLGNYLQKVREEERTHIAREIHDQLGQQLTVLKMDISWLSKKAGPANEEIKEKLEGLLGMIDETVVTVRRIAAELRPSLLDDLGLIPAMEWHLEEFEKRAGIHTEFTGPQEERSLSDDVKIGLFRILQESLTNVARHANAGKVKVNFKQNNNEVVLTITDDGVGMEEVNASKKTLGILGMKERTAMLGGKYAISGVHGKGTTVLVSIPLKTTDN